ncbi:MULTISPECIES: flagellar hook protein FlgE [Methylophaga]|uniref:Flagellar hook protein FlgE n=1 Tax=Methylophaga muralis TaxID=291169 RepID=A0A1E3GPQ1_9GAMM|nr:MULTISPECIES: flagellar hook protein FlgE [Methylophaga]MDO8824986.1 flagellar hook protein FlgE [Methylophaga sp.]ODN65987.1 Flagellar hook protein FlgE [Methylophaga muralis]THK40999.1 flagellar hook protein FlgE [Methylophaga sp. SB9B]
MSFNTALTGLNAATADLNVKSNNIANINTIGFKGSRAEFGDVYALSTFGNSNTAIGTGVVLNNVAQQFNQGNLEVTNNSLDLAISGNGQGFYALSPALDTQQVIYSRAGAFNINRDGYMTNSSGQYLLGFPVNPNGSVSSTALGGTSPIRLPAAAGVPQATTEVDIAANLPSTAPGFDPLVTAIDPTDPTTYTNSTSSNIFDSLGNESTLTYYYQKTNVDNEWLVEVYINEPVGSQTRLEFGAGQTSKTLTFDPALGGALDAGVTPTETYTFSGLSSGAVDLNLEINFAGSTQNSAAFTILDTDQNGFPTGRLTGLDINDVGLVQAQYSNGQTVNIGKIVLADFPNPQGLKQIGNTSWEATFASGDVRIGEAGTGSFGLIQSGALESSNVDLTKELVGLITAQRNFQANSKAIETNNAITQTIINLR